MREKTTIEFEENWVVTTEYRGKLTKVRVTDINTGSHSVGYAKLSDPDEYDEEFGQQLAEARAMKRIFPKIEKKLIRSLGD